MLKYLGEVLGGFGGLVEREQQVGSRLTDCPIAGIFGYSLKIFGCGQVGTVLLQILLGSFKPLGYVCHGFA